MKRCHRCLAEWPGGKRQPGVKDTCDACDAYLHCCLNCRHYNPALHNQCAIPTTDWVGDKAGANFCDEFDFADRSAQPSQDDGADQARRALGGLLGDDDTPPPDEGLDRFRKLFGD